MPKIISDRVIDVYPFAIVEERPHYLCLLRTPGLALGNTWQAVHGRIGRRETAVRSAARELAAQTRLQPAALWNIDYVNTFYAPEEDAVYMVPAIGALVANPMDVTLTPDHVDWEWATFEDAYRRFLWVGQRNATTLLHEEIAIPMAQGQSPNPYLEIDPALYGQGRKGGR